MELSDIENRFEELKIPKDPEYSELLQFLKVGIENAFQYSQNTDNLPFHQNWDSTKISNIVKHDIPSEAIDLSSQLNFIKDQLIPYFPSTGSSSFLAYIPSDPMPQSMIIAALTPFFNQFAGSVQGSPGGTAIESLVVKWIAQLLGLPSSSFGCFTSGGSMANLTAIYTGLVHQLEKRGINVKEDGLINLRRPMIYISDQTHNAIEKAIMVLGLGSKSIHKIQTDDDCRLTRSLIEKAIQADIKKYGDEFIPLMVVATTGTTNTGSIDDLEGIKEVCEEQNLWLHVDGAYGAFSKLAKLEVGTELSSIVSCDSIALDCHKWLYSPFEAGVVLVRDHIILKKAFELTAEYLLDSELENDLPLQRNFRAYGFPLTRELRGLKVWSVIMSYGKEGLSNAITRDILKADMLRELVTNHPRFELLNRAKLGVVCFRFIGSDEENDKILQSLQDRQNFYLSRTAIHGIPVIRACFINRRSTLETVRNLMAELDEILDTLGLSK
ncbi:MAG: aminotransferase class V-fold PLP-dependent enzyme [Candidatus Heimdallarchaeota archaeon]|nr:aminotransferase class V-fold PLP-dependent enzyme [Candidatus Heimdallarchaeota archaeon]